MTKKTVERQVCKIERKLESRGTYFLSFSELNFTFVEKLRNINGIRSPLRDRGYEERDKRGREQ